MTIPIPFTRKSELLPAFPDMGFRTWRWVISLGFLHVALQHEMSCSLRPTFSRATRHYGIALTGFWNVGPDHTWYDGPHCSFSFGYLHFTRSGIDCKHCSDSA